jgi:hypothetical protein
MKQPAKLSTMMKLASILSLVGLVASPFSASAVNCTISGEYFIDDDWTDPSSEDIDYAAYSLTSSYNASPARRSRKLLLVHLHHAAALKQVQARQPGEEKQVAENLRGKVGRYVYSAYLGALLSINCFLCGDDDDSVASSAVINPAVSASSWGRRNLLRRRSTRRRNGSALLTWKGGSLFGATIEELVGYGYPFNYAYACVITYNCPTEDLK